MPREGEAVVEEEVEEQRAAEGEDAALNAEQPTEAAEETTDEAASDDGEVIVTIGEEQPPEEEQRAPDWVRDLRKMHREAARENRELKERIRQFESTGTPAAGPGPKPTLEQHDYDTGRYEVALDEWHAKRREVEAATARANAEREEQDRAWRAQLETYGKAREALKVKDYEDAEAVVLDSFSQTQQGIVIQGAENPALVIYALGKNPKRAAELKAIADPVKFAFAVAKLEAQLKVTSRKAPPPERTVTPGSAPASGSVDSTLERLRVDAEKTGDYTKVIAYKRSKRQAQ